MTLKEQLLTVAHAYCEAVERSPARISTIIFNDGKTLRLIEEKGADLGIKRFEYAMAWFSSHWPDKTKWPAGVPRPKSLEAAQ